MLGYNRNTIIRPVEEITLLDNALFKVEFELNDAHVLIL